MRRPGYPWRALALGALLVGLAAVRPAGVRAATFTVTNANASVTGALTLSPSTAAVGSTVAFTGNGYTAFENVTVSITDSATACVKTNVATVQAGAPTTPGGTANINGFFVVPTNACTAVATASGTKNAGVTVTVSATGAQSGVVTSNSLVIPPTTAGLALSPAPPAVPTTAMLTGGGFAANEPVSFCFGAATFTVVVGQSDSLGNVTVSSPLPSGAGTGPFSVSATGLSSGFMTTGLQNIQCSGTGTNLQINGSASFTAVAGTATTLTIAGSGFGASSCIEVTVNAPAGFNNTVGQHATPPANTTPAFSPPGAANIQGDSIEAAQGPTPVCALSPTLVPNTFTVLARADSGGNLIATVPQTCAPAPPPCPGAPAVVTVPSNAPAGVYTVTGIDNSASANTGSTTFTLTPNPSSSVTKMTVSPVAPNVNKGVPFGGVESAIINNLALPPSAIVTFSLDDLLQSKTPGFPPPPAGFNPGAGATGAAIPLKVLACGGSTSPQPGPTYTSVGGGGLPLLSNPIGTGCTASLAGGLVAQVQLVNDTGTGANTVHTLTTAGALAFPDGVYTLVATSTQVQNVSSAGVVTYTASATTRLFAGVQLDHTTTRISLSSSQSGPGGSISVRGLGFAANSEITIWFGGQQAPFAAAFDTNPIGPGCAFSLGAVSAAAPEVPGPNDSYEAGATTLGAPPADTDNCNLTAIPSTLRTDISGSFNASVTLPGSTIASTATGVVLVEDFDGTSADAADVPPTVHLNESAIAPLAMTSAAVTGTLTLSPTTAAVGSTVAFTATGYTPFESVTVSITDSAPGCVTTVVATVQAGPPTTPGGSATVTGSFVVPTNACMAVNAGVTVTVTAVGAQSGQATSNSLVIPPTVPVIGTLTLSPSTVAVGSVVAFTGTGYTAFEAVSVSITDSAPGCVSTIVVFVQAGAPTTPGGTANVNGRFVVPTNACTAVATTSGTKNAGVTVTVSATGAQSGVVTSNSLVIPATAAGLTLSPAPPAVPTTAVLTGTGFAANEPVSFSFGPASSLTVVVGVSDSLGNVTISAPLPSGATSGLLFLSATGLTSGFTVTGLLNIDIDLALTNVPANITTNATSPAGAVVTYTLPTAVDEAGDSPAATVSCTGPASGSIFPIGTTTVTCTATDSDDANSPVSASFMVTVNDTDLGLANVPANITTNATSPAGAVVTYTPPTVVDEAGDSPAATVGCIAPSGSTFPIGTTTVTCTATDSDDANSPVSTTFTVTVKGAATQISDLVGVINSFGSGQQASLDAQLQAVLADLQANNTLPACHVLTAFVNHVMAQSGKKLTTAQANQLLAAASNIRAVLAC